MRKIRQEERAGIYITVSAHLVILIVLLATGLSTAKQSDAGILMDFSQQEEYERMLQEAARLQKEAELKQAISDKLQEQLGPGSEIRNVAVDRTSLKDDRGTDADKLYKDAERLSRDLKNGYKAIDEEVADPTPSQSKKEEHKASESRYSGPSVVSYSLEGRKASKLSIPAYRCMGAGEVKVIIYVAPNGSVLNAKVDETCSSEDGCLRSFAIRAARLSRFSSSPSAPPRQVGDIVYRFIAQ